MWMLPLYLHVNQKSDDDDDDDDDDIKACFLGKVEKIFICVTWIIFLFFTLSKYGSNFRLFLSIMKK